MRLVAAALLSLACLANATPAAAAGHAWTPVAKVPGIFDIGGPRKDGWFVVAGAAKLYLVDPLGAVTPFARGTGGYADDRGAEAYLTVSPGLSGPGCEFAADDVFILRLHAPLGITRVDKAGHASLFARVAGVTSFNGITFDTVGSFRNRLLVTSGQAGKTIVNAIDCNGSVETITRSAPRIEGGIEVAPKEFGAFGGTLIAPDELGGNIYAIAADGSSKVVLASGLPTGGDIGVESAGFIPPGMVNGGDVFYSDRLTPGNPHPGSDSLLRLSSSDLQSVGVAPGDLLVATEGGARMISVHCSAACTKVDVVSSATRAHGEGHLAFRVNVPTASPSPSLRPTPSAPQTNPTSSASSVPIALIAVIAALVVLGVAVLAVVAVRRGRAG